MKTKEKIVSKALEMFNEKGIEYVGMRELAAILEMRVSNITYYFPTKDDLVNHLSMDLNLLNGQIVIEQEDLTIETFLLMFRQVFRNHVRYRCLLLSFVHLMEQNKKMSVRYQKTQSVRNVTLYSNLATLIKSGYLIIENPNDIEFLVSTISLVARFWISEAAVSYSQLTSEQQIRHYVTLIAHLMTPYLSKEGKIQSLKVLESLNV